MVIIKLTIAVSGEDDAHSVGFNVIANLRDTLGQSPYDAEVVDYESESVDDDE